MGWVIGPISALEVVLHDYALYKSTFTLLYFTRKIVSEMTYTVLSLTLNHTVPTCICYTDVNFL